VVPSLPDTPLVPGDRFPLQSRLAHLCGRVSRHCVATVTRARYTPHIAAVDGLTGEIIEEMHALQALEVNRVSNSCCVLLLI